MFAIASGGWWGVGLGASRQKWGSLPEAHTDFIFAVLGEEFGLFGSLVVLAMIGILGYAGIRIATHADELFVRYAAGGITAWFMVQALINLGSRTAAAPDRRGSAAAGVLRGIGVDCQLLGVGVLLACARREPEARKLLAKKAMRPQAADDDGGRLADRGRRAHEPIGCRFGLRGARWRGTAGHTSPLIATGLELRRLSPGLVLTALGTARGLETTVVPAAGLELELIPPVPMPRRVGKDLCWSGPRLIQAVTGDRTTAAAHRG